MKTKHKFRYLMYSFALKLLGRGKILSFFDEISRFEKKNLKDMEKELFQRIKKICIYAYENTEYYHKSFDRIKINPYKMDSLKDFEKIPILTKQDIRKNLNKLISNEYKNKSKIKNSTGGSTGVPLIFYQDNDYYDASIAYQMFNWYKMGYEFGDKIAFIWGSDHDYKIRNVRDRINDFISNRIHLNTFNASEKDYLMFAKKLKKFKPKIIVAYTSSAYLFAKILKKNNIKGIVPKAIQLSAETIYPYQRKIIEEVFRTIVYNSYGSREVSSIAHQCSKSDMLHLCNWFNYLEVVDKKGKNSKKNTLGKVLITNLHNHAMPFLRYEIGDVAIKAAKKCKCGSLGAGLKEIKGRTTDIITTPEGKFVHGEYFTHLFYGIKNIKRFQVIQKSLNRLDINLVSEKGFDKKKFESYLNKKIKSEFSKKFKLVFHYLLEIKPEKSGKYRFTRSEIKTM